MRALERLFGSRPARIGIIVVWQLPVDVFGRLSEEPRYLRFFMSLRG